MSMNGDFGRVIIVLGDLKEHGEAVFMAAGIYVLSNVATKNRKAKDGWDEVLR